MVTIQSNGANTKNTINTTDIPESLSTSRCRQQRLDLRIQILGNLQTFVAFVLARKLAILSYDK
jgi:hypothetical protein